MVYFVNLTSKRIVQIHACGKTALTSSLHELQDIPRMNQDRSGYNSIFLTNKAVHSISINTFFKITHSGADLKDVAEIRPECKCDTGTCRVIFRIPINPDHVFIVVHFMKNLN